MTKKKVLIATHWMEIGGAEKSLLGLLETIDPNLYEVDMFLSRHTGEYMDLIPDHVNLLEEDTNAALIASPIKMVLKKKRWGVLFGRLYGKFRTNLHLWRHRISQNNNIAIEYSNKYVYKFIRKRKEKEYDYAISYLAPHYILPNIFRAKVYICWIHTDFSSLVVDKKSASKVWDKYDKIVSISRDCTTNFLTVFPEVGDKIVEFENRIPIDLIFKEAERGLFEARAEMECDGIKFLSIGRFCFAKNFENIPFYASMMKDKGLIFTWYIVGYGEGRGDIEANISKYNVKDCVKILGKKDNPYPYIKTCDYYVQPSRYEGKSIAVREAQLLGRIPIITNYSTAYSQLDDSYSGKIVPIDDLGCVNGILAFLNNSKLQTEINNNMSKIQGKEINLNKEDFFKLISGGKYG